MKLHEIKNLSLSEEELETKSAEDLWGENGDAAAAYASTTQYQARQIPDTSPPKYEAFIVLSDKRKPYGEFTLPEFRKALKPIRPNQTPDAEGFMAYVDPQNVDAFKYTGQPVQVSIDGQLLTMNTGDYMVRSVKGSSFEYSVEVSSDFEAALKKV